MSRFAALLMSALVGLAPARAEGPPPPPPAPRPAPAPEARTAAPAEAEPPADAPEAKGLDLPASLEVDPRDGYVHLRPRWSGAGQVARVEWSVAGTGDAAPRYTDFGPAGLIVAAPGPDDQVLVHAAALIVPDDPDGKPWLTSISRTVITGKPAPIAAAVVPRTGTIPPGPAAAAPPAPAPGQALSVVLVFDSAAATPELAALVRSPTLRAALAQGGARLYAYDKASPVLVSQRIKPVVDRARTLPVLVIIAPGGRRVLPAGEAVPLPLSGDAAADEQVLLNVVARAGG